MSVLLEKKIRVDNILTVNTVCAKAIEYKIKISEFSGDNEF